MKAVIMAGGTGTRLYPLTIVSNKHLLQIYDRPLIYCSIAFLIAQEVSDIHIVSSSQHILTFQQLLGNGGDWGVSITYSTQEESRGIGDVFKVAGNFIGESPFVLLLGDNIFFDSNEIRLADCFACQKSTNFITEVQKPEEYGVVKFDALGNAIEIHEKPTEYISNWVVVGLYYYKPSVYPFANSMIKSLRGEVEITTLNSWCLENNAMNIKTIRHAKWYDAGNPEVIYQVSSLLRENESYREQTSPEIAAYITGRINLTQLQALVSNMPISLYRENLKKYIDEKTAWTSS